MKKISRLTSDPCSEAGEAGEDSIVGVSPEKRFSPLTCELEEAMTGVYMGKTER